MIKVSYGLLGNNRNRRLAVEDAGPTPKRECPHLAQGTGNIAQKTERFGPGCRRSAGRSAATLLSAAKSARKARCIKGTYRMG
jgi:hypothetical protein